MSAASNFLENEILDHVLGETARNYTPSSALHLALFTGTASTVLAALESGTNANSSGNWGYHEVVSYGTDSSASGYTRKPVNFNTASGGSATNNGNVTFPAATSNYTNSSGGGSTVTCIAVVDAATDGNVLFYGQLNSSKEILNGDTFQISDANLTISLA